jgi:hypothetical protein
MFDTVLIPQRISDATPALHGRKRHAVITLTRGSTN